MTDKKFNKIMAVMFVAAIGIGIYKIITTPKPLVRVLVVDKSTECYHSCVMYTYTSGYRDYYLAQCVIEFCGAKWEFRNENK